MSPRVYIDTSALAKWYVYEFQSPEVQDFITGNLPVTISRLGVLEFHALVRRRGRAGELSAELQAEVIVRFQEHIRQGFVFVHPLEDRHALAGIEIMQRLTEHPLRTLDALHLATAQQIGARTLATADRVMAAAAGALGLKVVRFD